MKWWDTSWNPVVGCTPVSPGCDNCYAKRLHDQRHAAFLDVKKVPHQYYCPFNEVRCLGSRRLEQPLHWRKPKRIFVNSMSDLFHPDVPFDYLDRVFAVMALCPQHTFMILTKRPERMREYLTTDRSFEDITFWWFEAAREMGIEGSLVEDMEWDRFPLPNVWLGATAENQAMADERIPVLLDTPAAKRFVSVEPMLGPVDLPGMVFYGTERTGGVVPLRGRGYTQIDWIICGGETGPGARPMHPDWARALRDQCAAAGVPFFFKQWGEWHPSSEHDPRTCSARQDALHHDGQRETRPTEVLRLVANKVPGWAGMCRIGSRRAGRMLDDREHNDMPEVR